MSSRFSFTRETEKVPRHYEVMRLRAWVQLSGWPLSLVLGAGGVLLAALSATVAPEAVGMVLAAVGAVGIVGLIRCRRFEVVVTEKMLEAIAGPLRRRVPLGFIDAVDVETAVSWRRLYADRQVRVRLQVGERPLLVPSADPDELLAVLSPRPPG